MESLDQKRRREELAARRKKAQAVLLLLMGGLTSAILSAVIDIYDDLPPGLPASNSATGRGVLGKLAQAIAGAHASASYLGRHIAGDQEPLNLSDTAIGAQVAEGQMVHAEKLFNDAQTRIADAEPVDDIAKSIAWRVKLFGERLRGTANMVATQFFGGTTPSGSDIASGAIEWRLEPGIENHCEGCLEMAAGSPYEPEELVIYPGSGDTPCGPNCYCELFIDGVHYSL